MSNITITVSGPDGVINLEMAVLQRALEVAGFKVIVHNTYSADVVNTYYDHVMPKLERGELGVQTVSLTANHIAWQDKK